MLSKTVEEIMDYVTTHYPGMVVNHNWGERGLFYNPEGRLPKGIYVMTFKEKDGPNDKASNVNREGVYRLNLGLSKQTYAHIFGEIPQRPPAGGIVDTGHHFHMVDKIMPHPVYGWMSWIGVLNPSDRTFERLKPLIDESIAMAKVKYAKKLKIAA